MTGSSSATRTESLHVWQANDGRVTSSEKTLQASQPLFAIAREPGTDRYAVGGGDVTAEGGALVGRDGAVDLVDLGAQEPEVQALELPGSSLVSALAFADDRLVVGRWDGTVTLVDVSGPRARVTWTGAVPARARTAGVRRQPERPQGTSDRVSNAETRLLAVGANNCVIAVWTLPAES